MEDVKHVSEVLFNWFAKVGGAIMVVYTGMTIWNLKRIFSMEKDLAINTEADRSRDMQIKEIKELYVKMDTKIDTMNAAINSLRWDIVNQTKTMNAIINK